MKPIEIILIGLICLPVGFAMVCSCILLWDAVLDVIEDRKGKRKRK